LHGRRRRHTASFLFEKLFLSVKAFVWQEAALRNVGYLLALSLAPCWVPLPTLHHPPFTIHPSPSTLHHPPFTIHPSPYTLHHPRFTTIHPSPYTLHHTPPGERGRGRERAAARKNPKPLKGWFYSCAHAGRISGGNVTTQEV